MAFIFGGNTGNTYEGIQRQRKVADALLAENSKTPRNVGEGLAAIGNALAYKAIEKRAQKAEDKLRGDFNTQFSGVFGGAASSAPAYSAPMSEGDAIANDTMAALGKGPTSEDFVVSGLVSRGMPEHVARGFAMNFADESGFDPMAVGDNGNAFGLAQWNGPRKAALEAFAASSGKSADDPNVQLDYLMAELQGPEAAAWSKIVGAPDANSAAAAVLNHFERPAETHRARREAAYLGGNAQPAQAPQMDMATLADLASNPMASPGQKAVLEALIGQQMNAQDPLQQIELQRAQLELDRMQNPQVEVPKTLTERKALAEAAGLVAGTPEYQAYIATGNLTTPNGGAEFGLNPVLGRDADGNIVVMQLGKDGTAVATKLPEGVTPDIGLKAFEAAQGTALGKGAGEAQIGAQVALPGAAGLAEQVSSQINALKNDPHLDSMLGPIDSRLPNTSEDAARVQGMMDQLQGGAFLQARQLLKGGGAITDFEGQKAEAAFVRMNAAQKPEDFKAALDEFNYFVQQGVAKLEAQARGQAPTGGNGKAATHKFNPATGQIEQNGG
jgi:hypothetical protein